MMHTMPPGATNHSIRRGVSLVEVLVASLAAAIIILPLITVFTTTHGTTIRQLDYETALKSGEAALSQAMSVRFASLMGGPPTPIPFTLDLPKQGRISVPLTLSGSPANGQISFTVVNSQFTVRVNTRPLFPGTPPPPPPPGPPPPPPPFDPSILFFTYGTQDYLPPAYNTLATMARQLYCRDQIFAIDVTVDYPSGKERKSLRLSTCRADLSL